MITDDNGWKSGNDQSRIRCVRLRRRDAGSAADRRSRVGGCGGQTLPRRPTPRRRVVAFGSRRKRWNSGADDDVWQSGQGCSAGGRRRHRRRRRCCCCRCRGWAGSRGTAKSNITGVTQRTEARTDGGVDRYRYSQLLIVVVEVTVNTAIGYFHRHLSSGSGKQRFDSSIAVAEYRSQRPCNRKLLK